MRAASLAVSFSLVVQAGAAGVVPMSEAIGDALHRVVRIRAPHFSDKPDPTCRPRGISRDEGRRSWWTPRLAADLFQIELARAVDRGDVLASINPLYAAVFQTQGGADSGGTAPGEGSGGSSGSGSGSGSTPGGSTTIGTLSGESNTNTGNNLTTHGIVRWDSVGASEVDFVLYHNSRTSFSGEFGNGWSSSYEARIDYTVGSSAILRMPDGLTVPYTLSGGAFVRPAGWHAGLVHNADGSWTLTFKDQHKWVFSSAGLLSQVQDRAGNATAVGRDSAGKATSVTSADGRTLSLAYSSGGHVTSLTDPAGRVWNFAYSAGGDLLSIGYPTLAGSPYQRSFTYNAASDILTETDLRGKVWSWTYDSSSRLTSHSNPLGATTSYFYGLGSTTITMPDGSSVVHAYTSGVLTGYTDEAGFGASLVYDSDRNVTQQTDRRGKVWNYTYDSNGNRLASVNPLGQTTTVAFNSANDPVSVTTPSGAVTSVSYNAQGLPASVTNPLGQVVASIVYDAYGQRLSEQDALGRTTSYAYTSRGETASETDPAGVTTSYGWDILSRPLWVEDADSNRTSIAYDDWGRAASATNADGSSSTWSHDAGSHLVSASDEAGRTRSYGWDDAGRLISETNGRGDTETTVYNSLDLPVSITNGRGKTRTYTYTVRGEVASQTLPDGALEQWTYNANGDASADTNPLGQVIQHGFDDAGRNTLVDYPTGTDTVFSFDSDGRLGSMVDDSGTTSWTYSAASQVTSLVQPQGSLTYSYDAAGQKVSESGEGQSLTWTYSPTTGRLLSEVNGLGETTSYLYDSLGRVSRKTYSNSLYDQYSYDSRWRVSSIALKNPAGAAYRTRSYTYDPGSKILSETIAGTSFSTTTAYTYDGAGQLLAEARPGYAGSYTYDGNGNRLTRTVNGTSEACSYDDGDKLLSVMVGGTASKTFGYDAAGRTTSVTTPSGTTTFAYDYESRVTSLTGPGVSQTNVYNGLDTRVGMTTSAGAKTFLRDGADVADPVLKDGAAIYTPGVSERRGSTTTFTHSGLKNGVAQSTAGGSVAAARLCDILGNLASSSLAWQGPFGYGGQFGCQGDSSGLKLLRHRYYDSATGRFLTRDPIQDGRNWYAYCNNDPVGCLDPSGLWTFYRWLVTGDGNADDLTYEGGLVGLDDVLDRWIGRYGKEQEWALPLAALGALPFGGPPKPVNLMRPGARRSTSFLRILSIRYPHSQVRPVLQTGARLLKRAIVVPITPGGGRTVRPVPAVVAWFLWVEAAAAIKVGIRTNSEQSGARLNELVNARSE